MQPQDVPLRVAPLEQCYKKGGRRRNWDWYVNNIVLKIKKTFLYTVTCLTITILHYSNTNELIH